MTDNTVLKTKSEEILPYYIIPDINALAFERDPERLRLHRRRIAANIGDPDALRAILGVASEDFLDFYGTSDLPSLSTADTIDSFIKRFGGGVDDSNEDEDDVVTLAPPVIDYASILEKEAEEDRYSADIPADATLGVIDAFLSQQPAPRIKPKKEPKEEEKPSLTESFAKIMIKNGNYKRALEIFIEISLNNPEKSIYFADQIRFLKKVISLESL
ncbi:MAG: hypothetical protein K2L22_09550 [Muribaculaceae bacterium]|nr:hypothetical protein [Muribaculaceae bacterium]